MEIVSAEFARLTGARYTRAPADQNPGQTDIFAMGRFAGLEANGQEGVVRDPRASDLIASVDLCLFCEIAKIRLRATMMVRSKDQGSLNTVNRS